MRILSGIQPTNVPTLGNYIGAMKNFVKLQNELEDADILIFVADLHSITLPRDKAELKKNIKSLAALYLATGLDPNKCHLFIQSEVPCHSELSFILECNSYIGEMERMIQFKEKSAKQGSSVTTGLLTYPVLMASDILLYDTNYVPVGEDQKQHLEITKVLAERFNSKYGDTFVVPEPYILKSGARIMSLQDPLKKMSKSDPNNKAYVTLLDNVDEAKNKIRKAVTDNYGKVNFDPENQPAVSNLLNIYSSLSDTPIDDIVKKYEGLGYKEFKEDLANIVGDTLKNIQDKYNEIIKSKELDRILDEGRDYAYSIAYKKIRKVHKRIGLGRN
ncbi:MAG: tryptophan--tRNA ligase [Gammaproteobacteria bacterium]|nr:tryptophan--tRNA ligase [Gammaproteobacteria bacterium]